MCRLQDPWRRRHRRLTRGLSWCGQRRPFVLHNSRVSWYCAVVALRWTDSADRHGIERADALHALLNAYLHEPGFDEPRVEGHGRPDLWIGPQRTLGAPLLEVMTETVPPQDVLVFHVMLARAKFLALLDEV